MARAPETLRAGSAVARWSRENELACAWLEPAARPLEPLEHAAAVAAIHRHICVLPMRFGIAAAEEGPLRSLLRARREELLERLDCLEGAGEMALRIAVPRPIGPPVVSSATSAPQAYFQRRRAHYRQRDEADDRYRAVEQRFLERLRGVYRDWRRLPDSALDLLRLTFLVAREQTDAFRARLADHCGTDRAGGCLILGPWPPYSFV